MIFLDKSAFFLKIGSFSTYFMNIVAQCQHIATLSGINAAWRRRQKWNLTGVRASPWSWQKVTGLMPYCWYLVHSTISSICCRLINFFISPDKFHVWHTPHPNVHDRTLRPLIAEISATTAGCTTLPRRGNASIGRVCQKVKFIYHELVIWGVQHAPKGQKSTAQGNVLGISMLVTLRPVRAVLSGHFCPYRA